MPASTRGPSLFTRVWLMGWTSCVLLFDVFLVGALAQQFCALTFPTTEGRITQSGVQSESTPSRETSYRLALGYEYEVNGQQYTGTRYCSTELDANARAWHGVAAEFPVGAAVRVYYNPDDPADALLHPGLTGFHLGMIWFLTPFNAVMIGSWMLVRRGRWFGFDPSDARRVTPTDVGWLVRLPDIGRAGWFLISLTALTVLGVFVCGFVFGFNPPVPLAGWLYIGAFALAARIATRHAPPWLEVDTVVRVVRFAAKSDVTEVPFEAIRAVTIVPEKHEEGFRYHCELVRTDDTQARVATYNEEADAAGLVAWLREQVGLSF
jgi:hypothetical protein